MDELEAARRAYARLSPALRLPSLHPDYVRADACRGTDLRPAFFLYDEPGQTYYHPLHLAPVPETDWQDAQSAYGYGGPLASTDEPGFLDRAWRAYLDWCRERRVLVEFVRFHPLAENWRYHRGEVRDNRQTVWVDLTLDDLLGSYQTLRRRQVRKALQSGLRVSWDEGDGFLAQFLPLYESMLRRNSADEFYAFPAAYYEAVLGLDVVQRAVCWRGEEAVAAGLFFAGPEVFEYHLGAASDAGQQLGAMTLLLHEAAVRARGLGCRRYHLGGGTDGSPKNPLLFFKSGFSSRRAAFRTGSHAHDAVGYGQLRADWQRRHGSAPKYVLFYRF
jgi:hypothetical protein